ncbi:hypothetical protein [Bradyrhizobium sp. 186]|uniref:hypothetical protein n=1 Tax=Bradyrhizobium sp. 186 TaxID=2782654 RepID=UPI0020017373|nr:hypothetical protein [Bradyrhizobium sp. 186]
MSRKRTTAGAAPFSTFARASCRERVVAGNGLLDVLDRELQLLRIELLQAATEAARVPWRNRPLGGAMLRACRRDQSRPSTSAAGCDADARRH